MFLLLHVCVMNAILIENNDFVLHVNLFVLWPCTNGIQFNIAIGILLKLFVKIFMTSWLPGFARVP